MFTLEQKSEVLLLCFGEDGKERWRRKVCDSRGKGNGERTNASPSPVSDGKRVITMTGTGEVVAFSLLTDSGDYQSAADVVLATVD